MRHPFLTDEPCDCFDARAFRALLGSPAGAALDQLAAQLAVWKLRALAADLAAAQDWTRPRYPHVDGDRYDTDPLGPDEIRAKAAASWADFDRGQGPMHDPRRM